MVIVEVTKKIQVLKPESFWRVIDFEDNPFFKAVKNLVSTRVCGIVLYDDVFDHVSFFEFSDPESEHLFSCKMTEMVICYTYTL